MPELTKEVKEEIGKSVGSAVKDFFKGLFAPAEDPAAELVKANARIAELEAAKPAATVEKTETKDDVQEAKKAVEDFQKALDAALAKQAEVYKTQIDAQAANMKAIQDQLAKMASDALDADIAKRVDALTTLGKEVRDGLKKTLRDASAENRENTFKALEAQHTVAKNAPMFREFGHGGSAAVSADTAYGQIVELSKADTIRKSADGKTLTDAQAIARVIKSRPELYSQHRAERMASGKHSVAA